MTDGGPNYDFDVFISFSSDQVALARALAEALRGPLAVWLDEERMGPGDPVVATCLAAAMRSRHLIVIVSDDTLTNTYQHVEIAPFLSPAEDRLVIPIQCARAQHPSLKGLDLIRIEARTCRLDHVDIVETVLDRLGVTPTAEAEASAPSVTLAAWRRQVLRDHSNLIQWAGGPGALELKRIVVDPGVSAPGGADYAGRPPMRKQRAAAIRRLDEARAQLDLDDDRSGPVSLSELLRPEARLLVWGEPGCGKTTLLRLLAHDLAQQDDGPVPVFVRLANKDHRRRSPFGTAVERLKIAEAARGAASQRLHRLATDGSRYPVFLLDGLDEVARDDLPRTVEWLRQLSPAAAVLVTSRQQLQREVELPGFLEVEVNALSPEQQAELVGTLLAEAPQQADALVALLRADARLGRLARNPLFLTLLVVLTRDDPDGVEGLPRKRVALFGRATGLLLRRGHGVVDGEAGVGVQNLDAAREVLAALAFALHGQGKEAWARDQVFRTGRRLRAADPEFASLEDQYWRPGETDRPDLLDDLAANSGVFGPLDGPDEPWRFLHRTFREYLAAVERAGRHETDPDGVVAWVQEHAEDIRQGQSDEPGERETSRWGEVHSLLVGLVDDPRLLEPLVVRGGAGGGAAVRAVLDARGLGWSEAARTLLAQADAGWGDLDALLGDWEGEADAKAAALFGAVGPELAPDALGLAWFAVEQLTGRAPDRAGFFTRAGRWPESGEPAQPPCGAVIEPGEFVMGGTKEEQERFGRDWDAERPPHRVTLTQAYRLTATPVTLSQWRAFASGVAPAGGLIRLFEGRASRELPFVVGGVRLQPLAGGPAAHGGGVGACLQGWPGDGILGGGLGVGLAEVGWYSGNRPKGKLPLVGQKPANAFGLHDVHGLVWEWCEDSRRTYGESPQVDPLGLASPAAGRVLRGGSFWNAAGGCRAACRRGDLPSVRVGFGFRVRLPPLP